eukprot:9023699-Alexandrium_andersonii.AAC.1
MEEAMGGDVGVAEPERQACAAFLHSQTTGSADQISAERTLIADAVRELETLDPAATTFEEEVAVHAVVDIAHRRAC